MDEASKEESIHVVHYEKGQRVEHDIEVDDSKPVIPAVQDVQQELGEKAARELSEQRARYCRRWKLLLAR